MNINASIISLKAMKSLAKTAYATTLSRCRSALGKTNSISSQTLTSYRRSSMIFIPITSG